MMICLHVKVDVSYSDTVILSLCLSSGVEVTAKNRVHNNDIRRREQNLRLMCG